MAGYHPFSYKHSFYCHFNGFYILTRKWYERNTKLQLHNFNQFDYNNKLNKINKYLNAFQPMMAVQMEALRFRRFPLLHFHSRPFHFPFVGVAKLPIASKLPNVGEYKYTAVHTYVLFSFLT